MSLDVEQLVAQITAKVTAAVLAALSPQPVQEPEPDWPDYDEYGGEAVLLGETHTTERVSTATVTVEAEPRQSPLRARLLAGRIDEPDAPEADDDDDGPRVANSERGQSVVPISTDTFSERGAGFDPTGNDDWLARRYQREVVAAKRATPLEDQIKAV